MPVPTAAALPNNAADVAAGWAQNGGTKGEKDIEGLTQRLRMDGGTNDAG
eukprot:COSAG06_NODE_5127_length_3699_cov_22.423611_2_plen_50_part_00